MDDIFVRTNKILEPFRSKENMGKVPNPAFSLQISNTIQPGSNLYAVQKTFKGPFQFDVFYESASANHKLDGTIPVPWHPRRFSCPRCSQKFGSGDPSFDLSIRRSFQVDLPHPAQQPNDRKVLSSYYLESAGRNRLFLWFFD